MDLVKKLEHWSVALKIDSNRAMSVREIAEVNGECITTALDEAIAALQPGGEREEAAQWVEAAASQFDKYAPELIKAAALLRAPAPVAVSVDDAKRFAFIVEHNWIGTKTRTERGIADSDIQSARNAVDAALAGKVG